MRKTFTIIFFLILSTSCLFAINTRGHYSDSFNISAYKIGDAEPTNPYFQLYVVDSIYDSFLPAGDGSISQIDISNKVNNYLEDLGSTSQPRTTTFDADTMVFHVIAMGNQTGNYTLSISFKPLKNENGEVIKTAYTMGNVRVNFENSESSITQDGETYYVSQPIEQSDWMDEDDDKSVLINTNPISPILNFTKVISETSSGDNLKLDWAIASKNSLYQSDWKWGWWGKREYKYSLSNTISPPWIARSAVAMSIDKTDYDEKPNGAYTAEVTVTFQQKE